MSHDGNKSDPDRPEYRVYRSRRRILPRPGGSGIDSLRNRSRSRRDRPEERPDDRQNLPYEVHGGDRRYRPPRDGSSREGGWRPWRRRSPGYGRPRRRRGWLRWILIAAAGWVTLSMLAFAVSSQIQSMKLSGEGKAALNGNPWLLGSAQNILVIGTDSRPPDTLEPGAAQEKRCYEQQARGEAPHDGCAGARADTLMLIRAGGGQFRKLGIPRDSYAEIPGHGSDKINAAYSLGGAALQVKTVEQFLGVKVGHIVILNFSGFEDFINAIGGVKVDVPKSLCSHISGGKKNGGWTIRLKKGSNTLDGATALAYARTRADYTGDPKCKLPPGYSDLDRAAAQQSIMNGIKGRLTSPLRLPYNFIKGPVIGWTAPKAFVSDMGFVALPQLALSTVFAGSSEPDVLMPTSLDPMIIPESERQRAAAGFR